MIVYVRISEAGLGSGEHLVGARLISDAVSWSSFSAMDIILDI